ncbi:hypothetical protein GC101_17275 [Paenibacillus sp. LMG 31459]|uniref:Uncharacterized protein n=1 Tax=Paenibacillus phytohabitans TaxID=2654978 RepID=A0ABX1YL70_9BACL|nr:hypothetical protein [Paenibacillus phytohabitans]
MSKLADIKEGTNINTMLAVQLLLLKEFLLCKQYTPMHAMFIKIIGQAAKFNNKDADMLATASIATDIVALVSLRTINMPKVDNVSVNINKYNNGLENTDIIDTSSMGIPITNKINDWRK